MSSHTKPFNNVSHMDDQIEAASKVCNILENLHNIVKQFDINSKFSYINTESETGCSWYISKNNYYRLKVKRKYN